MTVDVTYVVAVVQKRGAALCKSEGAVSLNSGLNMEFKEKAKRQTSSPILQPFT